MSGILKDCRQFAPAVEWGTKDRSAIRTVLVNRCDTGSTGFPVFPGRRHQGIGPETSHLFRTFRHHGGRL